MNVRTNSEITVDAETLHVKNNQRQLKIYWFEQERNQDFVKGGA